MAEPTGVLFHASFTDPDDDTETYLGRVTAGPGGVLSITAAEPANEKFLRGFVDELNAKAELRVKVPPTANDERFDLVGLAYSRTSPDFLDGLRRYAEMNYGVKLRTDADVRRELAERADLTL